ncbi:MAG TPA: sugar phosphate nucleotidyltransferase [Streptosporangiaceae bacterium]|nr:sugar phosphate nucleotidyltransferase [Streptosporangiaceae bacterium]
MDKPFIGLLPAAGRARRLAPLRYPKELLPISYEHDGTGGMRARAVAEYAIEAIRLAEVVRLLLVVAPWKMDIVSYVGDGRQFGVDVGYLYQQDARGLPPALDLASPWCHGSHTVFALPDTIFEPRDALRTLRALYLDERADLALAIFPTPEPHRLGPVVLDGRRVARVLDKPAVPPAANTWAAGIWNDDFTALLHERATAAEEGREPVLGDVFERAIHEGMRVVGLEFRDGSFTDIGTPDGMRRCLAGTRSPVLATNGGRR